jgi:hypothetical protein
MLIFRVLNFAPFLQICLLEDSHRYDRFIRSKGVDGKESRDLQPVTLGI